MTSTASSVATAIAALAAVLALIWIGARALRLTRRAMPGENGGALSIRAVLALDSRRRVSLITCQGRSVLILTGGANDLVLGWLTEPPAP